MKNPTLKTILYAAFGYFSAAAFSFAFFYALITVFATSTFMGAAITTACISAAYLLVNHSEFIGEYEEAF